jgi:DUF971 family protein
MNPRNQPLLIHQIQQQDNHHFFIKWNDGSTGTYRLSALQERCPCAQCSPERAKLSEHRRGNPDVRAVKIVNVGRYALRIQFTSGCSAGIYDFEMLYHWEKA